MTHFRLEDLVDRYKEWSLSTFGPGLRTHGIVNHIRMELKEIEDDPLDLMEWIDVILLALDGARRAGFSGREVEDALIAKQLINISRKYPEVIAEQTEPILHIDPLKEEAIRASRE